MIIRFIVDLVFLETYNNKTGIFLIEFTMFRFLVDEKIKHIILACSFAITY